MKLCSECVMPETVEILSYGADGACSVGKQVDHKETNIDWDVRADAPL